MDQKLDDLHERIQHAILHNPHLKMRRLHIRNRLGRVVMQGNVQSYFEKQMAQETLRQIAGVVAIDNQLHVVDA